MPAIPPAKVDNLFSFQTVLLVAEQTYHWCDDRFCDGYCVLNTFTLAGQIVAMQTGLGFASLVDPASGTKCTCGGSVFPHIINVIILGDGWSLSVFLQFVVASFYDYSYSLPKILKLLSLKNWLNGASWMFATALIISNCAINGDVID